MGEGKKVTLVRRRKQEHEDAGTQGEDGGNQGSTSA